MKQIVILAGGKGTRLKSVLNDLPKPLADVGGTPILGHHLYLAKRHNFDEALVLIGHGGEQIIEWIADNPISGLKITCIKDGNPRGTAGAVLAAYDMLAPEFLVSYADTMIDVDLDLFYRVHNSKKDNSGTLFLHPNDHPFDSDLVEIDDNGRIIKFHPYPHNKEVWLPNLVNAALYFLKRDPLRRWKNSIEPIDFAKNLFPAMLSEKMNLYGYVSPEYIKDAGTPDRLIKVRASWQNGVISRSSLRNKQRAVFIDRDGTLNQENGYISRAENLEVFPFVGPALRRLNDNEWRAIVVTNQPVLARGEVDSAGMRKINARLDSEVAKFGAFFDGYFCCPHHPDSGFPGEVAHLKIQCDCRKPAPGLIFAAQKAMNIDLLQSWFVGDSTRDLGAAEAAQISSILVSTGSAGLDEAYPYEPSHTAKDFAQAVDYILNIYPKVKILIMPIINKIEAGQDWFIGGLARSGKTTLAAALMRELRIRGENVVIINLDRWLLSEKDRGETVLNRYELDAIKQIFHESQLRRKSKRILSLPSYSRCQRQRLDKTLNIDVIQNTIILWEGVIAMQLAAELGSKDLTIFVETGENGRHKRFTEYDFLRGKSLEEIKLAWHNRAMDESPIVIDGIKDARYRISLDPAFND